MYETLNAITAPPSTINPAVPEMVIFIVAKALAKKVEDRYQNAKDLADDLRTCCDTMPRGGQPGLIYQRRPQRRKKIVLTPSRFSAVDGEEEGRSASYAGLSKAFDSSVATMSPDREDVDELSKTFNMGRLSPESVKSLPAWIDEPVAPVQPLHGDIPDFSEPPARLLRKLLMTIVVLLVLSGIILYFGA